MKNIMKDTERPKDGWPCRQCGKHVPEFSAPGICASCQPSYYDSMKLGTLPKDVEYLSEYMHRYAKEQFS